MLSYLYKHWAAMSLPIAFYVTLVLLTNLHGMAWFDFLVWLQFPVYLLHQFEEHAWPGGFKQFVNTEVFHVADKDIPLDDRGIFWINIPFIWILFPLCAILSQTIDPHIGVLLAIFGLFNASIHIVTTLIKRKYNPGLWVSLFLNYPTGIYTLYIAHQLNLLGTLTWIWTIVITLLSQLGIIAYAKIKYSQSYLKK